MIRRIKTQSYKKKDFISDDLLPFLALSFINECSKNSQLEDMVTYPNIHDRYDINHFNIYIYEIYTYRKNNLELPWLLQYFPSLVLLNVPGSPFDFKINKVVTLDDFNFLDGRTLCKY